MDAKTQRIAEARAKLAQKFKGGSTQIGGKGTSRIKTKRVKKSGATDQKFKALLKKLGAEPIPDIAEVNMFTSDDQVLRFKNPVGKISVLTPSQRIHPEPDHGCNWRATVPAYHPPS